MGIENFYFFVLRSWQDERYLLSFFTELKTYHLSYLLYISIFPRDIYIYVFVCTCDTFTVGEMFIKEVFRV